MKNSYFLLFLIKTKPNINNKLVQQKCNLIFEAQILRFLQNRDKTIDKKHINKKISNKEIPVANILRT